MSERMQLVMWLTWVGLFAGVLLLLFAGLFVRAYQFDDVKVFLASMIGAVVGALMPSPFQGMIPGTPGGRRATDPAPPARTDDGPPLAGARV